MDWNWLFSSVAQSVASLVGVLGAFLISRIINSEALFHANRLRTHELIRRSEQLRDRAAARYFRWYNERRTEDDLREVTDAVDEAGTAMSAAEYYEAVGFSPYVPREQVIAQIEETIACAVERLRRKRQSVLAGIAALTMPHVRANIAHEREQIDQLIVEIKSHTREVRAHLNVLESNPERSISVRAVLIALLILFWSGVMYPLSMLPVGAPADTVPLFLTGAIVAPKALVLIVVGLVFTVLVIALWAISERLVHSSEDVEALNSWLDAASYSEYLAIRVANGVPL